MLNHKYRLGSGGRSSFPKAAGWCEPWPLISYHELLPLLSISAPQPPCSTTPAPPGSLPQWCEAASIVLPPHTAWWGGAVAPSSTEVSSLSWKCRKGRIKELCVGKHMFVSITLEIGHVMTSLWGGGRGESWQSQFLLSFKFPPTRAWPSS